jgi:hypothetical protein
MFHKIRDVNLQILLISGTGWPQKLQLVWVVVVFTNDSSSDQSSLFATFKYKITWQLWNTYSV